jgi:hypothetical protein
MKIWILSASRGYNSIASHNKPISEQFPTALAASGQANGRTPRPPFCATTPCSRAVSSARSGLEGGARGLGIGRCGDMWGYDEAKTNLGIYCNFKNI